MFLENWYYITLQPTLYKTDPVDLITTTTQGLEQITLKKLQITNIEP